MNRHSTPDAAIAPIATIVAASLCCALLAACGRAEAPATQGIVQTRYPGQMTAGGSSSGELMARTARPETDAIYAGGTPGIAGGAGGNTAGAETGGTVRETGQGPSRGVTQPSGVDRPGATRQPGESGGAAAPAATAAGAPAGTAAPAPASPAQAQAAAKKADADARAAQEKERLAATMDRVSMHWRQRAASEGYRIVPPTALATAAPQAPAAAADVTPPEAGIPAAAPANAAPGTAAAAPATGAAPRSVHALRSATVPIKSEKLGTARPSGDVKRGPTPTLPRGAAPTVDKQGVPDDAGKQ